MTILKDQIIGKKYKLTKKLGKGAFGEIWEALNFQDKQKVAIKFEDVDLRNQQLYLECKIYLWFHSEASVIAQAIPTVKFYGTHAGKNIMIMDLLGPSLESLFQMCKQRFSLKTTLMCALQMLKRVEYIHSRRIIHRDIKPDNFAIGYKKQSH